MKNITTKHLSELKQENSHKLELVLKRIGRRKCVSGKIIDFLLKKS